MYNRLTGVTGAAALTLAYDPAGRLRETIAGAATTRFLYVPGSGSGAGGLFIIGEYDGSGALLRRHVHGPAVDEPLVSYDGAGTTNRAWLIADALGSVIASTNASAVATTINTYDAFGQGAASNVGLFGFAGAPYLAPAGVLHLRARAYHPGLGRFLQADPILHAGGMNLYAYVGNDPVNATDPWGLIGSGDRWCDETQHCSSGSEPAPSETIVVDGSERLRRLREQQARERRERGRAQGWFNDLRRRQGFDRAAGGGVDPTEGGGDFLAPITDPIYDFSADLTALSQQLPQGVLSDSTTNGRLLANGILLFTYSDIARGVGAAANMGREVVLGRNLRIAPFGNRNPRSWEGAVSHYHRRGGIDPRTGRTRAGQGIGRHRPWERSTKDRSVWDRF